MKVLILFCGGTIIMKKNEDGTFIAPEKDEALEFLMNLEHRINEIAEIDIHYIANIDSTNMHPRYWNEMTLVIYEKYEQYDGFIITHGTDSMAYTASALSFSLQNLGKPVVLTGSQIPGFEIENDARRNFINAVKLATQDISGVYIVFGERVILGARASKVSESDLDAFITINDHDVGELCLEMRLNEDIPKRHSKKLIPKSGFEHDITIITLAPGNDPYNLVHLLDSDRLKGLIIQGYGSGNIPYDYYKVFEKAKEKRIPVIIRTQCLHGETAMEYYDVGNQALNLGVIEGHDLSLEAATTKLMWAIHHYSYEEIPRVILTNYVGEINTI